MLAHAQFEDGGRTFTCVAASSPATPGETWWWVTISGESQRYAMFRTQPRDTEASLRKQVLERYEKLLADRARPAEIRARWGRPPGPKPAAAPTTNEPAE